MYTMAASSDSIQKVLDSHSSDEIMEKVALKRDILRAKKLFEATAQVPSPSKDFTQIVVTEKGMVWRRWKISLRGVSHGAVPQPSEEVMLHEDFKYSTSLQVIVCSTYVLCTIDQTVYLFTHTYTHTHSQSHTLTG